MSFLTTKQQKEYKFADFEICNKLDIVAGLNAGDDANKITKALTINSTKTFDKNENDLEDLMENILTQNDSDHDGSNRKQKQNGSIVQESDMNPAKSNSPTNETQVIKVNEDDITDQSGIISDLFQRNLIDKFECRFDTGMQMFTPKYAKLSKSLQRKLINFHQQLEQFPSNYQELESFKGQFSPLLKTLSVFLIIFKSNNLFNYRSRVRLRL